MIDLGAAEAAARRSVRVGALFALSGATAYGINIVGARLCAQLGITGSDIVVYRGLMFLPLLIGIALATGRRLTLTDGERPTVLRFALAGAGTALCYMSSLRYLSVPLAVTIFYTYPLFVIVLTPYVDRVRLPLRRWLVALIAFAGVLLAIGPHAEALDPRGVALALAGSLCSAGMFLSGSRLTTDSLVTVFWSQLVALPLGLAFAYAGGGLSEPAALVGAALPFAVAVGGYFLGFLFQVLAAARISAATSSLLFLFEPVVAIAAAALALKEHIGPVQALGMVLVIGALAADTLPALRRSPASPAAGP